MSKDIESKLCAKKSALYIRVSTHYQIDKDSLPLQREDLINYSKYALGIDKYEVFEDAGYSGKNTDRPDFQRMMSRIREGEFSHLVVWKIDRISRNLLDFSAMYAELKKLGVVFVSKNEQFDTSTAMGEAMLKIILVFAELERNMTSERVTAVMLSRATGGQWNGGRVPFGYDYDKETKTFSINEVEAAAIEIIYSKYEAEHSLLAVARELNEKGILPRSGIPWNPTTVSTILKNPFYIGDYRYNYHDESKSKGNTSSLHLKKHDDWIYIENHHPAIIDRERFYRIGAYLEENRRSNRNTAKTYVRKNVHIFAGLLQCGSCGSIMQSSIDRERDGGYRPSTYVCAKRRRFSTCTNKYTTDVMVGPFVLNYIANILKAQNNFGRSTSLDTFERKLLRGEMFSEIDHIEQVGLKEMFDMLRSGDCPGVLYSSKTVTQSQETPEELDERNLLAAEKRKKERALSRLKSLYLYDEEAMSERDYIVEKKSLDDALADIDRRLNELEQNASQQFTLSDDEFLAKASYFIMSHQLQDKRFVNFDSLVRKMDHKILKEFVNSVIKKIVILDGKIMSIRFKNGVEHKFFYKT